MLTNGNVTADPYSKVIAVSLVTTRFVSCSRLHTQATLGTSFGGEPMYLKDKLAVFATGILVISAAGCTDRTSVSKENFAQVINQDYAANGDCLFSRPLSYPYRVGESDKLLADTRHELDALASEGLLTKTPVKDGKETMLEFAMTDAGRKVPGDGRFCYGKREVTSVDTYSPPSEFRGVQMTHVGYHYEIKDSATWAKDPVVKTAFPSVARAFSEQPVDEATLVLEKEGWTVENQ